MDRGRCIMCTGIRLLPLIHPFISSVFFLSNFQTLKFFVTPFSGTVKPRRLKLGIYTWTVGRCIMYTGIRLLLLIRPFISSLPIFNIEIFVTLFSGTVGPRRLKLDTHVDSGQMYCVYRIFSFSNIQTLKIFVTLFSGTVHIWTMGGCIVYTGIRLLLHICPLVLSFFFLSNFQTLKCFCHTFLRNCEA